MVIGIIIFLILHLILSLIILVLARLQVLKLPRSYMPVLLCVPIWGEVCALSFHFLEKAGMEGSKNPGMEKLEVDGDAFASVLTEETKDEVVIPLEEALLINSSFIKRTMILDILNQQPDGYLDLLQQARQNDDVEVVHYATTAMSELSKEYDLKLQYLESKYSASPEDKTILDQYSEFLESYIDKKIAQGQFLTMQRYQYSTLLQKQIERSGSLELYIKKTKNELELGNYEETKRLLSIMKREWPDQEDVWLLIIQDFAQQMQGEKIKNTIDEIKSNGLFLTSKGKAVIEFWSRGGTGS